MNGTPLTNTLAGVKLTAEYVSQGDPRKPEAIMRTAQSAYDRVVTDLGQASFPDAWTMSSRQCTKFFILAEDYLAGNDFPALRIVAAVVRASERMKNRYVKLLLEWYETAPEPFVELEILSYGNAADELRKPVYRSVRGVRRKIKPTTPLAKAIKHVGRPKETIIETFNSLTPDKRTANKPVARWMWENGGHTDMPYEEYCNGLDWGRQVRVALKRLYFAKSIDADPRCGPALDLQDDCETCIEDLIGRVTSDTDDAIKAHWAEGRSVVAVALHSTYMVLGRAVAERSELQSYSLSGANPETDQVGPNSKMKKIYVREGDTSGYLRLVATSRKTPVLLYSAADGGLTQRMAPGKIFGREVSIPVGSGQLAFHMRAALCHIVCDFDGETYAFKTKQGPVFEEGETKESWDEKYVNAVCGWIEDTIRLDPRSTGARQGFWHLLKNSGLDDGEAEDAEELDA